MIDFSNAKMNHYFSCRNDLFQMSESLVELLDYGFSKFKGGYFFTKFFSSVVREVLGGSAAVELSGYEFLVNGFHVEDYCSQKDVFSMAFAFLERFTQKWMEYNDLPSCFATIAFQEDDEFGCVAKFSFYIFRVGELVIDKNSLEGFGQPLLVREILR